MLFSCNEDLQNGNQQEKTLINNVVPGTNPKATTGGGDTKPYTSGSGYDSPWEMGNLGMPVKYYFNSYLSWEGIYVRVTPYIGLAYYDGADDGSYFGTNISSYPNLYQGGKEYG